jgi:hypothetical protein
MEHRCCANHDDGTSLWLAMVRGPETRGVALGGGWGVALGWRLGDDGRMGVLEVTDEVEFVAGSVAP